VTLDGDATLSLQIHIIQNLSLHILAGHSVSDFQQAVGECALAVVDVRHNAEVAYCFHFVVVFLQTAKLMKNHQTTKWHLNYVTCMIAF
jgi:hypothetical protein